jgi:hypothetical protein
LPTTRRTDEHPALLDFYNTFDDLDVLPSERDEHERFLESLEPEERELLRTDARMDAIVFHNVGGLVMPIILDVEYEDGEAEVLRIPAEIWRKNNQEVTKLLISDRAIVRVQIDLYQETADVDLSNNHWPPRPVRTRSELFGRPGRPNPMRELPDPDHPDQDADR